MKGTVPEAIPKEFPVKIIIAVKIITILKSAIVKLIPALNCELKKGIRICKELLRIKDLYP